MKSFIGSTGLPKTKLIRPLLLAIALLSSLVLTGCISNNFSYSTEELEVESRNFTAPEDKALVYLIWVKQFVGSAAVYDIKLNQTPIGTLRQGSYLYGSVTPGTYDFTPTLRIGTVFQPMTAKDKTEYTFEPGETYFLQAETYMSFSTASFSLKRLTSSEGEAKVLSYRLSGNNDITKAILAANKKNQHSSNSIQLAGETKKHRNNSIESSAPSPLAKKIIFSKKSPMNSSGIAVIIGNRNYSKNVPLVDYAHNDADMMKKYVVDSLGYRVGNVIDLRDATQADLISVLGNKENHKGKLFSWIRPEESDVFVYYSGHGAPGLSNGQGYLLPVDANPNTVELNGYPLETLYANLGKLPAKSLTIVVDACFSGSSQAGSVVKNASAISLKRINVKNTLPHATILTAAGIPEVASWDEDAKLGLFTRHFLEGVTGKADSDSFGNSDGKVTLGEMKNYLQSEVTYMARRLYNREQHPQVSGNQSKELARLQ